MASDLPTSVGFIGLGAMGYPMAQNLAKKLPESARIHIFDVSKEAMNKLSAEYPADKIIVCDSAKEVAERSDTILTMVPEGSHVRSVYLTPSTGILATDLTSKLLIDCSTIDTETSLLVKDTISTDHPTAAFYDAPVSGGVLGAEKATMTFMLGCAASDPAYPRLHTLLSTMGGRIFACGGPSLGLTAKLCNNYCSALVAVATSEALNIGIRSGMDPRVLSAIFQASTAGSTINEKWNPVPGLSPDAPASDHYKPGFKVQLMRKDFNLAVETAKRVGARTVLGEPGLKVYTETMEDPRCKDLDSRVVYRYLGGDENWAERFPDA